MPLWLLLSLLSALFAGLTAVVAKFGLDDISADLGLTVRTAAVFVVVMLNFFVLHDVREVGQLSGKAIWLLIGSGVVAALSWIFYYKAVKIGNVSQVALIDKGSIVITLILAWTLLKEPFTLKTGIGAALIVAGGLVLAWK